MKIPSIPFGRGLVAIATLLVAAPHAYPAGATTPFTSYEAEAGALGGGATVSSLTAAPTTQYSSPELEASGHAYVKLTATGHSVEWVNTTGQDITAINVRASVPDSAGGGGTTHTLDLYVNGTYRQTLTLTSEQTWNYEGSDNYNGDNQDPANGFPRVFFDEAHTFVAGSPIAPGQTFRLQRSASNTAAFYHIDVIDVENPPAPLSQPANSLSIATYGAVANNPSIDNTSAIQSCINAAQAQGKSVWIPQGTFYMRSQGGLSANGITIEGAGMWHSRIYRNMPLPNANPLGAIFNLTSCTVRNFALDSNAKSRAVADGCGGAMDTTGTNWLAENIWTQHTMSAFWASGTGGTIRNCRMGSVWADGINLNNVALGGTVGNNLTSTNNFIRGTGDDAHAINSVDWNDYGGGNIVYYTRMANVTVTNNTSIAPWGGKGQAIYGGVGHVLKDNSVSDTARYIGLGIGKFGANGSDLESATVTGNVVVRSGGNGYNQQQPAVMIGNAGDGHSTGLVENAFFSGNTITGSLYDAIGISESHGIVVQYNTITSPGMNGIAVSPPTYLAPEGSGYFRQNTVTGLGSGYSAFVRYSGYFLAVTPTAITGYSAQSGVVAETCSEGGQNIGYIDPNDWTAYANVDLTGVTQFAARVASANSGGTIEVRLDSPTGTLLGTCAVSGTGGWQNWTNVYCPITPTSGTHTVYLVYKGSGANVFNVQFFALHGAPQSPQLVPGDTIALEAVANGDYVCAENAGADPLIANRGSIGGWEKFTVVDAGGGGIALISQANGKYVSAQSAGAGPLKATANAPGSWESLIEYDAGNGRIALLANVNGKFVCADNAGADPLIANRDAVGPWESFLVYVLP